MDGKRQGWQSRSLDIWTYHWMQLWVNTCTPVWISFDICFPETLPDSAQVALETMMTTETDRAKLSQLFLCVWKWWCWKFITATTVPARAAVVLQAEEEGGDDGGGGSGGERKELCWNEIWNGKRDHQLVWLVILSCGCSCLHWPRLPRVKMRPGSKETLTFLCLQCRVRVFLLAIIKFLN